MSRLHVLAAATAVTLLSGCASLAPHYERPEAPVPSEWRQGEAAAQATDGSADSPAVSRIAWQAFFRDARLQQVIALALENNRDLRVAMSNIEKARAQYRIQRAAQLPSVAIDGGQTANGTDTGSGDFAISRQYSATVGFSGYELDLFGRVRSLKREALEAYLATEEAQRSTRLSLVAETAGDWLTLAADIERLALARKTLESQQESLKRSEARHAQGVASGLDLAQARTSVESARIDVATYTTQVEQDRNALELVVGAPVADALLPVEGTDTPVALAEIPAGLDSSLLLDRPDVLSAEHTLKSANADIGAARAAFFPTITLTGSAGRGSDQLSDLFGGGMRLWSFAPRISLPIFNAGSLRASLKVSEAQRDIAVATYEKAIQTAFREVADALAVRAGLQERLAAQQALVDTTARAYALAGTRYGNGVDSYLDVLDAQRSLYAAQQGLIGLRLVEASNRVTLYKTLGGQAE